MHFEITHDFEIPRDAIELAVISPDLFSRLRDRLANMESVLQKQHLLKDGVLDRVWAFQANVKVPVFAKKVVTREMLSWDETSRYELGKHEARWTVMPNIKPEWRKYFFAEGFYRLEELESGRSRRIISGELELRVPVVQRVAERAILGEIRKTFDAEAETLRDLATLT